MLDVRFFCTPGGNEPVRDWLRSLPKEDRSQIGYDIDRVQLGWPIGMPVCRPLGSGIHEVRSTTAGGEFRVLFFVEGDLMILVNGFQKKTQTTPQHELDLATDRRKEYLKNVQ